VTRLHRAGPVLSLYPVKSLVTPEGESSSAFPRSRKRGRDDIYLQKLSNALCFSFNLALLVFPSAFLSRARRERLLRSQRSSLFSLLVIIRYVSLTSFLLIPERSSIKGGDFDKFHHLTLYPYRPRFRSPPLVGEFRNLSLFFYSPGEPRYQLSSPFSVDPLLFKVLL